MRTYLRLAAVAAAAVTVAAPMAPAQAATGHVLTIGKAGGTAVKKGAVLKVGLAKGKSAVFSLGTESLTCRSATMAAKVTSNPAKPGKAAESLTSESFAKCTVNVKGVTFKSLKSVNLPFDVTVSDASGDPVKVTGHSKSKPISFTATVASGAFTVACSFKAASLTGHASNKGNMISFTNQKFTFSGGNALFCPPKANFSATIGPVTDSSVRGNPKVFVN